MKEIVVEYPWQTPPSLARTLEVTPRIHWLRLPLPTKLDHVNVYLLEDDDGLVLFDTGYNTEQLREIWPTILSRFELGKRPRILCSHYHPDHFGLVGHLCKIYGFELIMAQTEWLIASMLPDIEPGKSLSVQLEFYKRHGMGKQALVQHRKRASNFREMSSGAPPQYSRIKNQGSLRIGGRNWQVITAAGHTPEQVCLYCSDDKILLSADHILPRITPNTSIFSYNPGTNPLDEFMNSFSSFAHVDKRTLVLPGHDLPFYGVHERIQQLIEHHEERLDTLLGHCDTPQHAFQLIEPMFNRTMDPHQEMFALGEILAHLRLLEKQSRLVSTVQQGVERFQRN